MSVSERIVWAKQSYVVAIRRRSLISTSTVADPTIGSAALSAKQALADNAERSDQFWFAFEAMSLLICIDPQLSSNIASL
jgi:hypothetical protein